MFIIVSNKHEAKIIIDVITEFLKNKLDLTVNPKKNYYRPVYSGIDALGFKVTIANIKLSSKNKRSYRKKANRDDSNTGYFNISEDCINIQY